jgi:hypothetical protein
MMYALKKVDATKIFSIKILPVPKEQYAALTKFLLK